MPEKLKKSLDWSKHNAWKYFGAIFMDDKGGHQAVSFHKVLGFSLFLVVNGVWLFGGTEVSPEDVIKLTSMGLEIPPKFGQPPDTMIYTLWALLGLKGVSKIAETIAAKARP